MAVIEGVGDEVTLLFGLLLVGLVLVLAWLSTHTAELHAEPAPSSSASSAPTPEDAAVPVATLADSLAPPLGDEAKAEADGEGRRQSLTGDGPVDDGVRRRDSASSSSSSPLDGSSPAAPDPAAATAAPEVQRNMVLRLKFLNDTERMAQVTPQDTIGYIKRTYFSGQEQCVRLIYQGQLLQDDGQSLASLNLTHNAVLHCYISQHAARGGVGAGPAGGGVGVASEQVLNVGSLMVPVFVVMLAVLWYCHVQYRHVFTAPATASLMGITVFFSFVAFGVYRR